MSRTPLPLLVKQDLNDANYNGNGFNPISKYFGSTRAVLSGILLICKWPPTGDLCRYL